MYCTLNIEHDWENLCIHLWNQQTCTSDYSNIMRGGVDTQYISL